jgi:diguanylate cyclase (GGDEF)-like protein
MAIDALMRGFSCPDARTRKASRAAQPEGDAQLSSSVAVIARGGNKIRRSEQQRYVHIDRSRLLAPVVVLFLTVGAIAAVWLLVERGSSSREAQLQVASIRLSLADLQSAPFNADPSAGGSATAARAAIQADERSLSSGLATGPQAGVSPDLLTGARASLTAIEPVVQQIYETALQPGGLAGAGARVPKLQEQLTVRSATLTHVLYEISRADAGRAASVRTQIKVGAAAAMLLLLMAFAFFYFRSASAQDAVERLAREKEALLGESRVEARTDALTGLGNRRALARDLAEAIAKPADSRELLLAMFDLDGFKQYNDSFGHAAGDALLQRLGARLAAVAECSVAAYRMGGDEFCVVARCRPEAAEQLLNDAVAALKDSGEGWRIGCSHGAAWIPSEASTEGQALALADERMYANKTSRSSASRQVSDALLQVISEQNIDLDEHVERVSELAGAMAEALGEPDHEVRLVRLAGRLHDVGKTAIPATILDKPGPLTEQEREFIRRHPAIGERIVLAAPALADTAPLIRSSHERFDGSGYPDRLSGEDIPLGSRIIAVCDAFDAMTSERAYRRAMSRQAALEELERNSGTQFDAAVVAAFGKVNSVQADLEGQRLVSAANA